MKPLHLTGRAVAVPQSREATPARPAGELGVRRGGGCANGGSSAGAIGTLVCHRYGVFSVGHLPRVHGFRSVDNSDNGGGSDRTLPGAGRSELARRGGLSWAPP